jgi:hypothetical protein
MVPRSILPAVRSLVGGTAGPIPRGARLETLNLRIRGALAESSRATLMVVDRRAAPISASVMPAACA